jgi:hypothetical protein
MSFEVRDLMMDVLLVDKAGRSERCDSPSRDCTLDEQRCDAPSRDCTLDEQRCDPPTRDCTQREPDDGQNEVASLAMLRHQLRLALALAAGAAL